jgi:hypothetical protein
MIIGWGERSSALVLALAVALFFFAPPSVAVTLTPPPAVRNTYIDSANPGKFVEGALMDPTKCRSYKTGFSNVVAVVRKFESLGLLRGQSTLRTAGACEWSDPDALGWFDDLYWEVSWEISGGPAFQSEATICPEGTLEGTDADGRIAFRCLNIVLKGKRTVSVSLAPLSSPWPLSTKHYQDPLPEFRSLLFPMHAPAGSVIRTKK